MRKTIIVALCMLLGSVAVSNPQKRNKTNMAHQPVTTTAADSTLSFETKTFDNFAEFYYNGIQEKLYLHTDKPYYCSGEKIWFKGYVVNAITHKPMPGSMFIYVDLINSSNEVVKHLKIKSDPLNIFANCMELEPDLPEGDYQLRAYTRWMLNMEDNLLFTRQIRIDNPIDDRVNTDITYLKRDNGTVDINVKFTNSLHKPLQKTKVFYELELERKRPYTSTIQTNQDGEITINITPPADNLQSRVKLEIDNGDIYFKRIMVLPSFSDDFDVQFFPEGGHLIAGELQNVAFKAIGVNGLAVEVTGKLFEGDTELSEFASEHKGMGKVSFIPASGSDYFAEVRSESGLSKRVKLPGITPSGCALQIKTRNGMILCKLLSTPDIDAGRLALVVLSRGKIIAAKEFKNSTDVKSIPTDILLPGVTQIYAADIHTGDIYSQRLVYVKDGNRIKADIITDKKDYRAREGVTVEMVITDGKGDPVQGDFSISVTDAGVVANNLNAGNIESYLQLTSNLKGYIEDPGFYFLKDDADTDLKLDLLMMTQGWSRFDVSSILKNKMPDYKYGKETTQFISGQVKGFWGDAKRASILYLDPVNMSSCFIPLDDTNKFMVTDIDVMDSATVVIQALNRSGKPGATEVLIDKEPLPSPVFAPLRMNYTKSPAVPEDYAEQTQIKYYTEGGMRVIELGKVVVTERAKRWEERIARPFNRTMSRHMTSKDIEYYGFTDIFALLQRFPGVVINDVGIGAAFDPEFNGKWAGVIVRSPSSIEGRSIPALVIDGIIMPGAFAESLNINDIASVDLVVDGSQVIFGGPAKNGAVIIETKTGKGIIDTPANPSMVQISDIGYKKPEKFYQPKYDVPENLRNRKSDLRTTIAWIPDITTDQDGRAKAFFYTADKETTYEINIEGISSDGQAGAFRTTMERKQF